MIDKIKLIFRKLLYIYNMAYPVFNSLIFVFLLNKLDNTLIIISIIYLTYEWYNYIKVVLPRFKQLWTLLAKINNKGVIAVYGGVGSGKTTFATYLMNRYYPKASHFYNFYVEGANIFSHKHLFLKDKLPEKPCILIDEAGGFYDSFKYEKKFNAERKDIIAFNKYFRQFYGDGLCIYVDQSEANLNTALYRSIYFVVQLDGIREVATSVIPNLFYKLIIAIKREVMLSKSMRKYNRKDYTKADWKQLIKDTLKTIKITNMFSFQEFSYFNFSVVGDYGNHYSINKDEALSQFLIPSKEVFNNSFNTRIFKDYNPATDKGINHWGFDGTLDKEIMQSNFGLIYNEIDTINVLKDTENDTKV